MTLQDYRAHPAHSYSALKNALRSPFYYHWKLSNPIEQTHDMLIGNLAEAVIMDGADLRDVAAVKPDGMSFATKDGKAWRAEQTLPVISMDDAETIIKMCQRVRLSRTIQSALRLVRHKQVPMFGELPEFPGFALKGCADLIGIDAKGHWFIIDFKTCPDASESAFKRTVSTLHYDLQAALYCELAKQHFNLDHTPGWAWIASEKKQANEAALWYAGDRLMDRGMLKLRLACERVRKGEATGEWPGVTSAAKRAELEISPWELARLEESAPEINDDIPH